LNYAAEHFLRDVPIVYVLTVVGRNTSDEFVVRGLFIGDDSECFYTAARLSLQVNFEFVPQPIQKAVVYLDPHEFHSTWLGNKAIYRTRMALADGADLIILAPGVKQFGEDPAIDALIRKYGYRGTPATLEAVNANADLASDLSAAAHLIHGSSEGRFTIRWCPGQLSKEEVTGVGFEVGDLKTMLARYSPQELRHGCNRVSLEELRAASLQRFGKVDILINCAGIIKRMPTLTMPEEAWADILNTNLTGTLRACQIFGKHMLERGYGRIVNIASLNSFV